MKTKEVKVTMEMFGEQKLTPFIRKEPVAKIINSAYSNALKTMINSLSLSKNITENSLKYNKRRNYFESTKIKHIIEDSNKIKITYFKPDTFYEIDFNSATSFQFINKKNLPQLQNTYAQGRPLNGSNQWLGAETNEIFSYGPKANALSFDGSF